MKLMLIGVNHKTAPVEVRERFAVAESDLSDAIRALAQFPGVDEGLVLSTCNRVEWLACAKNGDADLRGFLRQHHGADVEDCSRYLYEHSDRDAVRHVFRVASSLDSMIVGEPQILGQVKQAYAVARAAGAVHSHLDALVTRAFSVAKRVRTETQLGASAVSVASVAVELARKIFGTLEGKHVCVVGAGKMSELAARYLVSGGAAAVVVANRTHHRAAELAQRFGGQAVPFAQLYDAAESADIVISSTGSSEPIFRRPHGERFLARRKNRPMFFIDIAVPRDVDPEMNRLDGIFVYDIDDLQTVVASHIADRAHEARRAEQIIEEEVDRFVGRLQTLEVVPTIVSLQEHLENIRQAEVERVRGRLGELTPEQELAIEAMTRGIVNKVLHTPITALKNAARDSATRDATLVELVRRIFNLRAPAASADSGKAEPQAGAAKQS